MKVQDIMSRDVVTVSPGTSLKDVAQLLVRHRIAGIPVCDPDGHVVGVVSEADILWKEARPPEKHPGLLDRVLDAAYGDEERVTAETAADAMTAPALTIAPVATVDEAARLMIERSVNRLPVVEDGRLVGIVARADLVRAFTRSDDEILKEIEEDVLLRTLWVDPDDVSVMVQNGKVSLGGRVENRTTAQLAEAYVRRVPGVVSVESDLSYEVDDRSRHALATTSYSDSLTVY